MSGDKKPTSAVWNATKPFLNGGLSGMGATCIIQPIDMVKVRLQIGTETNPVSTLISPYLTGSAMHLSSGSKAIIGLTSSSPLLGNEQAAWVFYYHIGVVSSCGSCTTICTLLQGSRQTLCVWHSCCCVWEFLGQRLVLPTISTHNVDTSFRRASDQRFSASLRCFKNWLALWPRPTVT